MMAVVAEKKKNEKILAKNVDRCATMIVMYIKKKHLIAECSNTNQLASKIVESNVL